MNLEEYFSFFAFFNQNEDFLSFIENYESPKYNDNVSFVFSFNRIDDDLFYLDRSNFFGDNIIVPDKLNSDMGGDKAESLDLLDTSKKFFYRVSKKINKTVYPRTRHSVSGNIQRMIKEC